MENRAHIDKETVDELSMKNYLSLNQNKSFRYVYIKGRSIVSSVIITYVVKNRLNVNRVGITTSKKIGNAVERNRARRIIKAAYMRCSDNLKTGYDIVFVARGKTVKSNSNEIYDKMIKQFLKFDMCKVESIL